ncbi:MAG: polysaccharide deacetylase [Alicyclobacillus sp.]|nr:polysaccharide deacetylase [Alicyclobacillus sp.]
MTPWLHYHAFLAFEWVFRLVARVRPLDPCHRHLFLIARRTYLGRPFTVDGVSVKPFDQVVELHLNNTLLAELLREEKSPVSVALRLLEETRRSLPVLANALQETRYASAQAVYGITFVHRHISRFGFTVLPLRSRWLRRLVGWHLRHVLRAVNPRAGELLLTRPGDFEPKLVAAGKQRLIRLHLPPQTERVP